MNTNLQRLLIVSHVVHYRFGGKLYAYGPYAREVDIWADLFPQVLIASPCREEEPPGDCMAFTRSNIDVAPQRETGGVGFSAKASQLFALPLLICGLSRAMRRSDAIHVRCPGNLGLLGTILAPLFSSHLVAKYAGQWTGYPGEARTVRLQRIILRSRWWRGPVTVYGQWPGQPNHVIPFFTSILTGEQVARAKDIAKSKRITLPLQAIYVGRLSEAKNVSTLLSAIAALHDQALPVHCTIVGDGPCRAALETQTDASGIREQITFTGALPFDQVLRLYEQANVLVLASETEGWPKAIAEGMAFGLVCIGSNRGLVPQMLGEGRGIVVPPRDVNALASVLANITREPGQFEVMRLRAAAWAQHYSLDGLRDALHNLLTQQWGVSLAPTVDKTTSISKR